MKEFTHDLKIANAHYFPVPYTTPDLVTCRLVTEGKFENVDATVKVSGGNVADAQRRAYELAMTRLIDRAFINTIRANERKAQAEAAADADTPAA